MNEPISELTGDLRDYVAVCEEVLEIATMENQALREAGDYQAFPFYQGRKSLLPRLDRSLNRLRCAGGAWQRIEPAERSRNAEVKSLLDAAQNIVVKILVLDRENQEALLRRGLLPARHIPSASSQRPHYVAGIYQRNSAQERRGGVS